MTAGKMGGVDDAAIAEALAEWPSPVRTSASWEAAAQRLLAQIADPVSKSSLTAPAWQETIAHAASRHERRESAVEASSDERASQRPDSTFASSDDFDADWDDAVDAVVPPPDDDALFLPPLPRAEGEPEELDEQHVLAANDIPERRSGSVSPPMAGRSESDVTAETSIEAPISMRRPSVRPSAPGAMAAPESRTAPESRVAAALPASLEPAPLELASFELAPREPVLEPAPSPEPVLERAAVPPPEAGAFGEEAVTAETSMAVYESPLASPGAVATASSLVPPPISSPMSEAAPSTSSSPQATQKRRALLWGGLAAMAAAAGMVVWMKNAAPAADEARLSAPSPVAEPEATSSALASMAPAAATPEPAMSVPIFDRAPPGTAENAGNASSTVPEEKPPARASKRPARRFLTAPSKPKKDDILKAPPDSSAMRIAAAPSDTAGGVPQRPANGAVQGALSLVLPKARACLRRDEGISRATLIFDSSGAVRSVSITGASVGKPAEGCIRTALRQMKLPPFAEPKFSAIVTVRPP
ncbi:hypothetical protein [Pendulispora albinea]|uniref:Uncharacterized protein n=1 Tax=Pendulispora albinea TaxID=2741071 RepID=A0ABZ2LVA1_9BACT